MLNGRTTYVIKFPTCIFRLVFELRVTQNGNDGSTIDLGDVKVSTSPSGVSVTFRCEYPVDISLTSKSFSVQSVEGHGTQTAVGNLADGFSLSLNADEIIIGQMLQVSVTWSLSLSDIVFYLRDCAVEQGESSVSVIRDGCFSEALKESLNFLPWLLYTETFIHHKFRLKKTVRRKKTLRLRVMLRQLIIYVIYDVTIFWS